MSIIGKILVFVLASILLAGCFVAYLYFTDYGVEAVITDKGSDSKGKWVEATTKIGGFKVKQYLEEQGFQGTFAWYMVQEGNFVVYNIKSGRLRLWENEQSYRNGEDPVYDTA